MFLCYLFLASRSRTGLFMVLFLFGHVQRNGVLAFLFLPLTQRVEAMFSFLAVAVLCFRRWAGFQLPHFLRLFEFFGAHHPENDFGGTLLELVTVLLRSSSLDYIRASSSVPVGHLSDCKTSSHVDHKTPFFEIRQQRIHYFTPFLITT